MILLYHKIALETPSMWWIGADAFDRQMADLQSFDVVHLDDYDANNPRHAVITFDGVYENVYHNAFPILKKWGYPFELFIIGTHIGGDNSFDSIEPLTNFASLEQLREMSCNGGRVQWHTATHQRLDGLDAAELQRELTVPTRLLSHFGESSFRWLAYPHGDHSQQTVEAVRARFCGALSCEAGNDTDRYQLNRITVLEETRFSKSSVAVIIANYNYRRFVVEAIESVLAQTMPPDEILVIDDCSTDGSEEVIQRYAGRVRFVRNDQNLGIVANFNKAVGLTASTYVAILGADNRMRSDYVERCKAALDRSQDVGVVYTDMLLFGWRAKLIADRVGAEQVGESVVERWPIFLWRFPEPTPEVRANFDKVNFIHGSSMYRRQAYDEAGGYQDCTGPEDHDLFKRMLANGWRAERSPHPLIEYRQHSVTQANTALNMQNDLAHWRGRAQSLNATVDRVAQELEEARRAWEGAMEAQRQARAQEQEAQAQARVLADQVAELLRERRAVEDLDARCREAETRLSAARSRIDSLELDISASRASGASAQQEVLRLLAELQAELKRGALAAEQRANTEARLSAANEALAASVAREHDLKKELESTRRRVPHAAPMLAEIARQHVEISELHEQVKALTRRARQGARVSVSDVTRLVRGLPTLRSAFQTLRNERREERIVRQLEDSGLFDRAFYLAENGDVARNGIDPVLHFLRHGAAEGRDPHPLFDTSYYLETNADVARAGVNPLRHFVEFGWKERRRPNPLFDVGWYLDNNPDVSKAGINPLVHFIRYGAAEGRNPNPTFDVRAFQAEHPTAAASGRNPLEYVLRAGDGFLGGQTAGVAPVAGPPAKASLNPWRAAHDSLLRNALVVDHSMLTPDKDSGSITTLELIKSLQSLGFRVTFVPADLSRLEPYAEALEQAGIYCLTGRELPSVTSLLETDGARFDLVVLARVTVASSLVDPVRRLCPKATLVFESMDLHFLREQRAAQLSGSPEASRQSKATEKEELETIRRADITLVHSTLEAELLRQRVPEALVYVLPYVLEARGRGAPFSGRRDIVFVGGFKHHPNEDAVAFFVRDIFPRIRRTLPGVRFLIVGSDPTPAVRELARDDVLVLGHVPDLETVLDACVLTVAPLRFGAGYKGKVAMSLAHGVPVVLTEIAAEGMGLSHGREVLIADEPAAFADAVVRLHRDAELWSELSDRGLRFVTESFSPSAAREHVLRALTIAGADLGPHPGAPPARSPRFRQTGRAVFPSRFMRELHAHAGLVFDATSLVPHGVEFKHAPDAPRVDRRELVEPGALKLLFAGRLVEFKGLHTVLDAMAPIAEGLPHLDVRLSVVGDRQDAHYLDRVRRRIDALGIGHRVHFAPPVNEGDLFDLFQQHDIYLFPSLYEPFALTLLLALEAGIPTVASDAGGNVDIVVDQGTGLLFPAGDAVALARAVVELAGDGDLRSRIAAGGRMAAEQLTTAAMVDRIEEALRKTVPASHSAEVQK
jgi:glycosyltransferase involved in cell wall biosynthesis/GT2 family glycosyltransferase